MSRTNQLRRLSARLVVESNRLDRLSEALLSAKVPYWSKKVRELQRTIYGAHIAVGELADAARDPRGAKRQPSTRCTYPDCECGPLENGELRENCGMQHATSGDKHGN